MTKLPNSFNLSINQLSSIFNDTTNSYKFYWLLAILEKLKNGLTIMNIDDLVIEMISDVWYPINQFKLSFGKQDQFNFAVKELQTKQRYIQSIRKSKLIEQLNRDKETHEIKHLIKKLSRWVPQRFIRPWFAVELRGMPDHIINREIMLRATNSFIDKKEPCLYRFIDNNSIEINPIWKNYLLQHMTILEGFVYWHLTKYLQKQNPNVSNLTTKLQPSKIRNLSNARSFWDIYIAYNSQTKCIYSAQKIFKDKYSIDHFLPWSFTGHDQLWNLIPTSIEVNSSKSDNLPEIGYLNSFITLQYDAFHTVIKKVSQRSRLLEDYSVLFNKSLEEINSMRQTDFEKHLLDNIKPQMQIAKNMGFQIDWSFQ